MEENRWRLSLLTAIAPVAWGSTYYLTDAFLPPDRPLFAAAVRALPVGLLLLAWRRELPRGDWWWRSVVLGVLTIGMFFPLIFLAAYRLPGGLAATLQATSPLAVMALAWVLVGERASTGRVLAGLVGLLGVAMLVLDAPGGLDALGLAGAFGSVLVSAVGFVLVRRWRPPVDMVTLASWQLVSAGLVLVPVALVVEGPPPALDAPAVATFAWLGLVGTGLAYVCWFRGLQGLGAGPTALIGLLNPVVGTLLGVALAAEPFGATQLLGMVLVLGSVVAGQPAVAALLPGRRTPERPTVAPAPATAAATGENGPGAHSTTRGRRAVPVP